MIQALVAHWSDAMVRATIQGTLVLAIAFLLVQAMKRLSGTVRCWVWRLAFLKILVALLWPSPIALPVLPARIEAVDSGRTASVIQPDALPGRRAIALNGAAHTRTVGESSVASLVPILFAGWLAGVAWGISRVSRQYRDARMLVDSASPVTQPNIITRFVLACRAAGVSPMPEVRVSDMTDAPLLYGIWRPSVVLPSSVLAVCTPEDVNIMLAHELAHVRRSDLAWSALATVAEILFFFHPLVRWAHGEMREVQEIGCDEQAIRSAGVAPHEYGAVLMRVAANCGGPKTTTRHDATVSVAMAESFATIQRRLTEMQTVRISSSKRPTRPWLVGASVAVGFAALLPWRLEAQNGSAARKKGDGRTVQVGGYTLHIANIGGGGAFSLNGQQFTTGNLGGAAAGAAGTIGVSGGGSSSSAGSIGFGGGISSGGTISTGAGGSLGGGLSSGGTISTGAGGSFGSGDSQSGSFTISGPAGTSDSHDFHSNLLLGIDVEGRGHDESLLVSGIVNARGTDNLGRPVRGFDLPGMAFAFTQTSGGKHEMVNLHVEPGAKSLKTLEGDLLVTTGTVRTVTFAASEVNPGAVKQAGAVTFRVDSVRETESGYEVSVTCETPPSDTPQDPHDQMRIVFSGSIGFESELVATNGFVYKPVTMAGQGAGGSSTGGSSTGGSSTSSGAAGSFSVSAGNSEQTENGGSIVTRQTISFPHPRGGAKPKSLVFRTVERQGESKRIPFRFTDVSLSR